MPNAVINLLLQRRSVPIQELVEPAPEGEELDLILKAAIRVPDHGQLVPWRFILYKGGARETAGRLLADLAESREGELPDHRRQQELTRFSRAPLVIGVVSCPQESIKIPQWEMFLSGGMVAMNLMIAANALGYRTNMITNWYSDTKEGRRILGLSPAERVIGFVHIGSHPGGTADRPRPDAAALVSEYTGPYESKKQ